MKRFIPFVLFSWICLCWACSSQDNGDGVEYPKEKRTLELAVTGRVGTVVDEKLTDYVKSLDLFLFRQNVNGVYVLYRNVSYTKSELEALLDDTRESAPGYTNSKTIDFGDTPIGNYWIAGVGNAVDSVGNPYPDMSLSGVATGATMEEVIATIKENAEAPRLFFGLTEEITLGAEQPVTPALTLFRKVAMFALTLENVPSVVSRIDVLVENMYSAFDMAGKFLPTPVIAVSQSRFYQFTENQDSVNIALVTLPTISGQQSSFTLFFYLQNGQVITIPLPDEYVLKANTITKLTATINSNEAGGNWDVKLQITISANVEWNVDQEPPITI